MRIVQTLPAPYAHAGPLPGVPAGPGPSHRRRRSIALYTPSADPSGMGVHMLELAAEYVKAHDVSVLAWATGPGERLLDRARVLGARAVPLPHPRAAGFADAIRAHLRAHRTDVFHVHVGTGRENFDGARAARAAGVPAVLQTQHYPWLMGSTKHQVPFFRALAPVDHVLAVSEAQRRTYERIGVPSADLTTVANGIAERGPGPGRADARAALGLGDTQPVVLTVGRLNVMKGHTHLIAAVPELARRFPDVAVVVLGAGHLHDSLRRQSGELGVEHVVHLPGHRPDARLLLDAADVFVLPSLHEGMPLALLEAMDARLPVVATRVIGSEEVVVDGETGLLVRPRDAPALAGAIGRLLADPQLREQFAAAGRARFTTRFTSARMAEQTLEAYDRVLDGRTLAAADPYPGLR